MKRPATKPLPVNVTFQQGDIEITVSYENYDEFCKAMERSAPGLRKFSGMRALVESMQYEIERQP